MSDPIRPAGEQVGSESPADGHHLIQQAEVPPLDVDGVQAATVGTGLFALAAVIMALGYDRLTTAGDGWWLGVAVSGFGLGLISLAYTISRRRRRRRSGPAPRT